MSCLISVTILGALRRINKNKTYELEHCHWQKTVCKRLQIGWKALLCSEIFFSHSQDFAGALTIV
jgi:hypothetical protein